MRFLCLPGSYGSSDKFQVQLAPIVTELTSDESATFHFINGNCEATPPEGFEEFFGQPPYHRFIEPDDPNIAEGADVLSRIRDFPECETPEDTMRELMREGVADCRGSTIRAIQYLYEIMEKSGPFDGVIGYSEGATLAATLLLFEQVRKKEFGIPAMLKCGVFFMGWPPLHPKWLNLVLADETDMMIEVPTTHIIGSLDPYLDGSMALYNVCDQDSAYIFDTAKGHTLPREKTLVKELGDTLRNMIAQVRERDAE
ncbi:unnamed protein product [Parascedosporium putredinis]|uniref:Serine hydrolase domain-containing protein n=1 Tax=Parascedosporium putredinis TaxID=1442378 RepID=A0A9P1GV90_9PEZI|nr:unnamed protein product [Parascedosporium putredinis]CAI7988297.1 unnamed protein product [Parascedosporium putredinis]